MRPRLALFLCLLPFLSLSAQSESGYGKNILTLSPAGVYISDYVDDTFIGLNYERILSRSVGVTLPINLGVKHGLRQAGIGVKVYPKGNDGVFRFAIISKVIYSQGHNGKIPEPFFTDRGFLLLEGRTTEFTQVGFNVGASLNLCIEESFFLGGDLAVGVNYLDRSETGVEDESTLRHAIVNFNMGYRF